MCSVVPLQASPHISEFTGLTRINGTQRLLVYDSFQNVSIKLDRLQYKKTRSTLGGSRNRSRH
ncbi:hypothetical protein M378DRAFT_361402 [Amanita muscaria Koide BX008]|uniref:Uncharacterized protein n=1 Tax=Amanita muscaria (strain Koide BX008) TaxID=946122 RepID=A0A0C2SUL3_AMAMK|nr:hypothetical protein M378DRAFT_361402 [Amanita muscaria Koide BX008]